MCVWLAASGYACSSASTTSGLGFFMTARCSGSAPFCANGGKERRQHATKAGRQAGALLPSMFMNAGEEHIYYTKDSTYRYLDFVCV